MLQGKGYLQQHSSKQPSFAQPIVVVWINKPGRVHIRTNCITMGKSAFILHQTF